MTEVTTQEPRPVTAEERLAYLTLIAQRVVARKQAFMDSVGKASNSDYSCQELLDQIDAINLALGEHGARQFLEEVDLAREVCQACKAFALVAQEPSENQEQHSQNLTAAFQAVFMAAGKYELFLKANNAPAFGPDDNATVFNEGEPQVIVPQ